MTALCLRGCTMTVQQSPAYPFHLVPNMPNNSCTAPGPKQQNDSGVEIWHRRASTYRGCLSALLPSCMPANNFWICGFLCSSVRTCISSSRQNGRSALMKARLVSARAPCSMGSGGPGHRPTMFKSQSSATTLSLETLIGSITSHATVCDLHADLGLVLGLLGWAYVLFPCTVLGIASGLRWQICGHQRQLAVNQRWLMISRQQLTFIWHWVAVD